MPPTRHQRNNTANSCYTYYERKKDAKVSGWGSLEERLGKEAVKDFDCCSLTLQPCREPLCNQEGLLVDREALLEYLVAQKKENQRKLREWEKERQQQVEEVEKVKEAEHMAKVEKFMAETQTPTVKRNAAETESSVSNMSGTKRKEIPSFWVPSQLPTAKKQKCAESQPDQRVFCPFTGKPLRLKDFFPVHFKEAPFDSNESTSKSASISRKHRYICAVTGDILTNSTGCAVLKPTGDVVTLDCVEKIIKRDWRHPLTGLEIKESDVIPLKRGGTGFAATNEQLKAKLARPVLELQ